MQANVTAQERKFSESIATIDRLWKTYQAEMESLRDLLANHVLVPRTGTVPSAFPPPPLKWDSSTSSDQERASAGGNGRRSTSKSKRKHGRTASATTAAVLAPLAAAGVGGVVNSRGGTRRSSAASGSSAATSVSGASSTSTEPMRLVSPSSQTTSLQKGPTSPRALPSTNGSVSSRIRSIEAMGPQPVLLPRAQSLTQANLSPNINSKLSQDIVSQASSRSHVPRSPQSRRKEKSPPHTAKMGNRMGEQSPSVRSHVPPNINMSAALADPSAVKSPRRRRRGRHHPKRSFTGAKRACVLFCWTKALSEIIGSTLRLSLSACVLMSLERVYKCNSSMRF